MKSHLRSLKTLSSICMVMAVALTPAFGQPKTSSTQADQPRTKYDLEVTSSGILFHQDKETPATLGHAVDILRQLHPELTFALSPGLGDVRLSELKLYANDVDQTLEALRLACGNRFVFAVPSHMPDKPDSMRSLYLLQADEPHNRKRMVEAFNLGPWLATCTNKVDADRNLASIKEMIIGTLEHLRGPNAAGGETPEFMYHESAHVLVVIGTPEAIEVAAKLTRAISPMPAMNFPGQGMMGSGSMAYPGMGNVSGFNPGSMPPPNQSGGSGGGFFGGSGGASNSSHPGGGGSPGPGPEVPGKP